MPTSTLRLELRAPVAEIRLPAGASPIGARFLQELDGACAALHEERSIVAVLLTSEGPAFATGEVEPHAGRLPFRALEEMGPPVIAVIEGEASGAGLELALACDIRVASDGATFSMPYVAHGAVPAGGGSQRLPRLVGRAKASELILLGGTLDAPAAFACGLVNAVTPPGSARAHAERVAASIAKRGPVAVRYAKEAILRGLDMPLEQALRYETDLTVILQTTDDRAEGVRAFTEKRPPKFQGM